MRLRVIGADEAELRDALHRNMVHYRRARRRNRWRTLVKALMVVVLMIAAEIIFSKGGTSRWPF